MFNFVKYLRIVFKYLSIFLFILIFLSSESFARKKNKSNNSDRQPSASSNAEEGDDAYDPFADFSEFEYENDEQADINFFKNGRMLNLGFMGGYGMFTGDLAQKVQNGFKYGIYLTYFIDLRFALQFSYSTADYPIAFHSPKRIITGVGNFNAMSFNAKYYFNTQNVTRGFAKLNPYLIGGFSNQYKTLSFSGVPGNSKAAALGLDIGAGIEVPFLRKKMYWGVQGTYHQLKFNDSYVSFIYDGDNYGDQIGDHIDILGILGINF